MGIQLFQHNKKAYEAAVQLMEEEGKAAIIHPTGTGKSFIAFKMAEENPKKHFVWLAPSEYIFKTQLENLRESLGEGGRGQEQTAKIMQNITFLTYSKLMKNEEDIEKLCPDYIVLDEFHRCGAELWGKSVWKLLDTYPEAKILGLSATNIRYLDNQRDMAQEIFEGQIASEMTLGEAVVAGILPAPKYVISLYSYQEEVKRLQKRVKSLPNKGLQKTNEELLEKLRRALEQAEGLEKIFAQHMAKAGKYIVFCANKEHMEEMQEYAQDWFRLVDSKPHIYTAYFNAPETGREFAAFKEDDSEHLKLLYCIDMLNEGVHIADIDGVILLRPTVSPILYLQQIGRSLSAGKNRMPVIFDIVNNFDSLYCIDCLEQEVEDALAMMPATRGEGERFEEPFQIYDEVRECRALFKQLQKNLSASWEIYYVAAKEYYQEHGNIRIPKSYVTPGGLTLGSWLQTQRRVYAGKRNGELGAEQIEKLNALGMVWDIQSRGFQKGCEELENYRTQFGHVDVKARYETEAGYPLGKWIANIRQKYNNGTLPEEQKARLDALGFIWDKQENSWEEYFRAAERYYQEHGSLEMPCDYCTEDGLKLGAWLGNQRRKYRDVKSSGEIAEKEADVRQRDKLASIGMTWDTTYDRTWSRKYELAKGYFQEHGNLEVPSDYQWRGVNLGVWVARQKKKYVENALPEERKKRLEQIGMK